MNETNRQEDISNAREDSPSRRKFLGQSGAAIAGAMIAGRIERAYSTTPGRVLGANDKINIALIGAGMRGANHLDRLTQLTRAENSKVNLAAVCEIYDRRKEFMNTRSGLAECHHNYEDILAMPDIDAIVIATPDHWHKKMSIDAMQAGKHVYCEKPMTLYWEEAKEVVAVQKATGKIFQVGAQSASQTSWWEARKLIGDGKTGVAGKVLQFQTSYNRNVPGGDWNYTIFPDANEQTIDWKRWLGPAPDRPFDAERFFRFRKYWDYSGGLATDLMYHRLAHMSVALGFPMPKQVSATGGNYVHFDREVPDTLTILANMVGDYTGMIFATSGNDDDVEEMIRCQHGTVVFKNQDVIFNPQSAFQDVVRERLKEIPDAVLTEEPRGDKKIISSVTLPVKPWGNDSNLHMDHFLDSIRTGEQPPLNAEQGYHVMTTIALGIKAYRENKVFQFDAEKEILV